MASDELLSPPARRRSIQATDPRDSIGLLEFAVFSQVRIPLEVAAVSGFGEADRMRRPKGDLDAGAASWTMKGEEDSCLPHRAASPMSQSVLLPGGRTRRRRRRRDQHKARGADQAITDAIDRHVQAEQRGAQDDDGTAGVLAPVG